MQFYQILEQMIGAEVELFENRNTGRLEIRPSDAEAKSSSTGKYIGSVGEDYVVIEFRGLGNPHYDAYPFAQVTLRNWDDALLDSTPTSIRQTESGKNEEKRSGGSRDRGTQDWLG